MFSFFNSFFKKEAAPVEVIVEEITIDEDRYNAYHNSNAWGR